MTATPIYDAMMRAPFAAGGFSYEAQGRYWRFRARILHDRAARAAGEITDDTPEAYK